MSNDPNDDREDPQDDRPEIEKLREENAELNRAIHQMQRSFGELKEKYHEVQQERSQLYSALQRIMTYANTGAAVLDLYTDEQPQFVAAVKALKECTP